MLPLQPLMSNKMSPHNHTLICSCSFQRYKHQEANPAATVVIQAMSAVYKTVCIPKCKQHTLVVFGIESIPGASLFGPILPIYGVDPRRWSSTRQSTCWVHRQGPFCRSLIYLIPTPIAGALTLGFSCTPYPYPHKPVPVLDGYGYGSDIFTQGLPRSFTSLPIAVLSKT